LARKIMTLKIGQPGISLEKIGIICALRKAEIEAFEADGKRVVKDYMRTSSIEDGAKRFEMNKGSLNRTQREVESLMRGSVFVTR